MHKDTHIRERTRTHTVVRRLRRLGAGAFQITMDYYGIFPKSLAFNV